MIRARNTYKWTSIILLVGLCLGCTKHMHHYDFNYTTGHDVITFSHIDTSDLSVNSPEKFIITVNNNVNLKGMYDVEKDEIIKCYFIDKNTDSANKSVKITGTFKPIQIKAEEIILKEDIRMQFSDTNAVRIFKGKIKFRKKYRN